MQDLKKEGNGIYNVGNISCSDELNVGINDKNKNIKFHKQDLDDELCSREKRYSIMPNTVNKIKKIIFI